MGKMRRQFDISSANLGPQRYLSENPYCSCRADWKADQFFASTARLPQRAAKVLEVAVLH
jgi:hypothetical protein